LTWIRIVDLPTDALSTAVRRTEKRAEEHLALTYVNLRLFRAAAFVERAE
jgi:hypothetical protein